MNKELARKLLFIVNDKNVMSELDEYIKWRTESLYQTMEFIPSEAEKARGALQELRRFKTLKEEVHKAAE